MASGHTYVYQCVYFRGRVCGSSHDKKIFCPAKEDVWRGRTGGNGGSVSISAGSHCRESGGGHRIPGGWGVRGDYQCICICVPSVSDNGSDLPQLSGVYCQSCNGGCFKGNAGWSSGIDCGNRIRNVQKYLEGT